MKKLQNSIYCFLVLLFITSCSNNKDTKVKDNNENKWQTVKVTDEFGDIIEGELTLSAQFKGTFSNSAVEGERLTVNIQVIDSTFYTTFYEYNNPPMAELPSFEYVYLKIKIDNGEVVEARQLLYNNAMLDSDKELLNILLEQKKPVKVIMDLSEVNEYSRTKYNFEIDPKGLKESL
jgi:hypothetical protein